MKIVDPASLSGLLAVSAANKEAAQATPILIETKAQSSARKSGEPAKLPPDPLDEIAVGIKGLFVLGVFYTLYAARALLIPLTVGVLLFFLLSPAVRGLKRKLRVPIPVGAGVVLGILVLALIFAFYSMAMPAAQWLEHAPENLHKAESKLYVLKAPFARMNEASGKLEEIAHVGDAPKPAEVSVKNDSGMITLWSAGTEFLEQVAIVIILTFFLLASGDMFLRKTISVIPRIEDKLKAVDVARNIESEIGHYLVTVSAINLALGCVTALAMYFLGMPTPLLWGLMVAFLTFIPYLGATVNLAVLTVVALVTFDTLGHALLVPGIYLVIDIVIEQLVNPVVIGRRLELNPVVVFVSLVFWGWMWGIVGALAAMPILVVFKIFCDHIERYQPLGAFLGGAQAKDDANPTVAS